MKQPEKIQIKFLEGPKTDQVFTFFEQNEKIKIGRVNDCDIKFDDSALSRYQCQYYNEESKLKTVNGYCMMEIELKIVQMEHGNNLKGFL